MWKHRTQSIKGRLFGGHTDICLENDERCSLQLDFSPVLFHCCALISLTRWISQDHHDHLIHYNAIPVLRGGRFYLFLQYENFWPLCSTFYPDLSANLSHIARQLLLSPWEMHCWDLMWLFILHTKSCDQLWILMEIAKFTIDVIKRSELCLCSYGFSDLAKSI